MPEDRRKLENFKTAVIVVLFLTTILLLFLVWRTGGTPDSFKLPLLGQKSKASWIPAAEEFIEPDAVIYGYGDGTYTKNTEMTDYLFREAVSAMAEASGRCTIAVSEITEDQYRELLRSYETVRIEFPFPIPFGEFCDRSGIKRQSGFDAAESMEEIFVCSAVDESFFICSGGKYYRFMCDSELYLGKRWVTQKQPEDEILYSAEDLLGVNNTTPVPLAVQSNMAYLQCSPETDNKEDLRVSIAEAVFGEKFEFVRRITDNFGTVTYMYGYGQKTLTSYEDGTFEYRTEQQTGQDAGFYKSLETAIAFVADAGGWGNKEDGLNFLLTGFTAEGGARNKVYNFEFSQLIGGNIRLYSEEGPAIKVQVSAGSVCYFSRDVVKAELKTADLRPAADAVNVIAGNCNLMYKVLSSSILSETSDEAFTYTCESLRTIDRGRIRNGDEIIPGWIISLKDGSRFFFNLYDGSPLGFTRK